MALKDWEKNIKKSYYDRTDFIEWRNKNNDIVVLWHDWEDFWNVYLEKINGDDIKLYRGKNKDKAILKAKQYIKAH